MFRQRSILPVVMAAGAGGILLARSAARSSRFIDLRGRSVLITGGSRGLGLVLARQYAARGCRVAICARNEEELARAREDLQSRGADVLAVRCDVTRQPQVEGMVEGVLRHFGEIDILVNNAGVIQVAPAELMTLDDYEQAMRIHFWAPLYATMAVLPHMYQRLHGRIINITSIGGKLSFPHLLPYNASKFALVGFSQGLRAELAQKGIFVTTVVPGLMRTGSPRQAFFKGKHHEEYSWFAVSDSLPLLSTSVERAARQVVRASQFGDAEVILSLPAKLGALFHGLFPGLTADLFSMINRMLPAPGGIGTRAAKGAQSETTITQSPITALSTAAAARNNE